MVDPTLKKHKLNQATRCEENNESDSHTLVLATYEAFTVEMTAFIRFLAAVMREVALSNWKKIT